MEVEYHWNCNYDKLYVLVEGSEEPEDKYCGYTSQNRFSKSKDPRAKSYTGHAIRVILKSDNIVNKKGFEFSWSTNGGSGVVATQKTPIATTETLTTTTKTPTTTTEAPTTTKPPTTTNTPTTRWFRKKMPQEFSKIAGK